MASMGTRYRFDIRAGALSSPASSWRSSPGDVSDHGVSGVIRVSQRDFLADVSAVFDRDGLGLQPKESRHESVCGSRIFEAVEILDTAL